MNKHFIKKSGQACIIATPDVWLEGEAERQLAQIAERPDCVRAVGMPDLHPGPGIPIGAVFGFRGTVHPHLVGSDAGCGALVVALGKTKVSSSLERRVRAEFSMPAANGDVSGFGAVWNRGPAGLRASVLSEAAREVVDQIGGDEFESSGEQPDPAYAAALGSIGGGNHFAELGRVKTLFGSESEDSRGLKKGELVILCHSGSRGLGKALADKWGHEPLHGNDANQYLAELAGTVRFARANRVLDRSANVASVGSFESMQSWWGV